jgi:opacity protein-like surface antigen
LNRREHNPDRTFGSGLRRIATDSDIDIIASSRKREISFDLMHAGGGMLLRLVLTTLLLTSAANADPFSGSYVGALAGYNHLTGSAGIDRLTSYYAAPSLDPIGVALPAARFDIKGDIPAGTFLLGWGKACTNFYWGFEADITLASRALIGTAHTPMTEVVPNTIFALPTNFTLSEKTTTATLRARLGVLPAPSTLIYMTGGVAVARMSTRVELHSPSTIILDFEVPESRSSIEKADVVRGFVIGAGAELGLSENFSARAEYAFTRFDSPGFQDFTSQTRTTYAPDIDSHSFRVGIVYRLASATPRN